MPLIDLTATPLPNDDENADAVDVSGPVNAIISVVNGNLDDANIKELSGAKLKDRSIPSSKMATRILTGTHFFTNVLENDYTKYTINFPAGFFTDPPVITTGIRSAVPGGTVLAAGFGTNVTTNSFELIVYRTNTTSTYIDWIAIQSADKITTSG